MAERLVTMGVDQTAGGLDVSVSEWPAGATAKTPLLAGKLYGYEAAWQAVAELIVTFVVDAVGVDPFPDNRAALALHMSYPETVTLVNDGVRHNAASLEEAVRRIVQADEVTEPEALVPQVIDPIYDPATGVVTYRLIVPPDVAIPAWFLMRVDLAEAVVLEQPNGTRMVEVRAVPEKVTVSYEEAAVPDFPAGPFPAPPPPPG